MRGSGEPMDFGIFYFYKVLSRAFSEEGKWDSWDLNGRWGMSSNVATAHPTTAELRDIVIKIKILLKN